MHLHSLVRTRLTPVYLVVAAFVGAATMSAMTPTPKAHAEEGRRLCMYVWQQEMGNPEGRPVSLVLDYKKDGKCPYINPSWVELPKKLPWDPDNYLASWMPPLQSWHPQPAPKMTCEEFRDKLKLPNAENGGDPCTYMDDDVLYGVTGPLADDPSIPLPLWKKKRFWGMTVHWS
jgi:hypothetical protein